MKKNLFIFAALIVVVGIILYFLLQKDCNESEMTKLRERIEVLEKGNSLKDTLTQKYDVELSKFASTQDSLRKIQDSVRILKEKIKRTGSASASENAAINRMMKKINQLLTNNRELAESLRGKIDSAAKKGGYEKVVDVLIQTVADKQREINALKQQFAEMNEKVRGLEVDKQTISEEKENLVLRNTDLTQKNQELSRENEKAKILSVTYKKAQFLNKNNEEVWFFSKTRKIRFHFSINENPVADAGAREVYICVINPQDRSVFHTSKTDVFSTQDGRTLGYSLKTQVNFNNSRLDTKIEWEIGKNIKLNKKTRYEVEFYIDGILAGAGNFSFKDE